MAMSTISNTHTVASILKNKNSLKKANKQIMRVRFKLPNNLKDILQDFLNEKNLAAYQDLIQSLKEFDVVDDDLYQILQEMRENIFLFDKKLKHFVESVIVLDWLNREPETIKEYQSLIIDTISTHNHYDKQIIKRLIKDFFFSKNTSPWENSVPSDNDVMIYKNIHYLLEIILKINPLLSTTVVEVVIDNFPYITKSEHIQECYVHNILEICKYAPSLRYDILYLIIIKLIKLDAHSPKANLYKEEDNQPKIDEAASMFAMEIDDDSKDTNPYTKHPYGRSLDCLMNYLFKYIQREYLESNSNQNDKENVEINSKHLKWEQLKVFYCELLKCFEKLILPTHNIEHTQFLLFYICSFKNALAENFLQFLWNKVCSPNVSLLLRQSSILYLVSFLARANYYSICTLKSYIKQMADWIHNYIANQEGFDNPHSYEFAKNVHTIFYAICQSLFYIIAFRHKDLSKTKQNLTFLQSLNLTKIVTCQLNPLKYCLPIIVQNFASFTRNYQLAYCYTIIEHNARSQMPIVYLNEESQVCSGMGVELESSFPFDPYALKVSSSWIQPLYRIYESNDANEVRKIAEEKSIMKDEEDDFLMTSTLTPTANSTTIELFNYSTSPGFKTKYL